MSHIFISHQHTDRNFALFLEQKLQTAGFDVWLDTNLHAGEDWRKDIDQALDEALVVCIVLTPDSVASTHITYEWARALGARIPVVPLLLKPVATPHPRLRTERVFDFTRAQSPPWDLLLRHLQGSTGIFKREIRIPVNTRTVEVNAIRALDLPTPIERHDALENLLSVGNTDMVKEVLADAVLNATFGDVRASAAVKYTDLTETPDRRVLPGLIEALSQPHDRMRFDAARAITYILDHGPESPAQIIADVMLLLGEATFWPALVAHGLCDPNQIVARLAETLLKAAADPSATPALIEVLRDDNLALHDAAIGILAKTGKPALPDLVEALYTSDPVNVTPLLRAIWVVDPFYLIEALHHPNPNLRHAVRQFLISIGTPAVPVLEHALAHSEEVEGRVIVIQTLAEIGGAEAMLPLMAALSQPLSQVRAQAALALGKIQARQALPVLLSLVGDDHFEVKWQTLEGLRLLNDPRAVYGVTMALEDNNSQIRLKALRLISELGATPVLSDLAAYLSDSDPDVRWEIASMLLASDQLAGQGVVAATREQPSERRHWVVKRLALHGSNALPDLFAAITDLEQGIRELAAITVIDLIRADPTQNIMPELVVLLQHEDPHIRDLGLKILNSTESDAKPSLLANWNRPSDGVKAYVLQALRDTRSETVPALITALERYKKPTDIWYILDLLSKLGDESLAPLLLAYLKEANPTLRWAAARAFKTIVTPDAEPALTAALDDPDARVQAAAHEALLAIREEQRKKDFWTKSE